jgi:hypothetical protein
VRVFLFWKVILEGYPGRTNPAGKSVRKFEADENSKAGGTGMKTGIAIGIVMVVLVAPLVYNAECAAQRRQEFAGTQSGDGAKFTADGLLRKTLVVTPIERTSCRAFLNFLLNADLNRAVRSQGFTQARCGDVAVTLGSQ